jgi:pimeloyl-ACP methyl ester carboxylesterase
VAKLLDVWVEDRGSPCTVFAFGGINGRLGIGSFEFQKVTRNLDANLVFARDNGQAWYQSVLAKKAAVPDALCELAPQVNHLLLAAGDATRVITIGNSMGGYAALVFGALLKARQIIAFSPQTFIGPSQKLRHLDYRWAKKIVPIWIRYGLSRKSYDASSFLWALDGSCDVKVFYGERSQFDKLHAKRLVGIEGVEVTEVSGTGHDGVKTMRESGELAAVLSSACESAAWAG